MMFQKTNQIVQKEFVRVIGIMLLGTLAACQSQAIPVTEATPTLSQTITATPPTRSIGPDNAAQVTRRAQLGNGMIYGDVKISLDGKTLAVPTTIGVDLYDAEAMTKIRTLPTGGFTTNVALSPDGSTLAADTAGSNRIQLWDVYTGDLLLQLTPNSESISFCMDLAFSPDGETIAVGYDQNVQGEHWASETWVWNVKDGKLLQQLKGGYWLDYAPDGKKLLTMTWDKVEAGERIMRVYDLSNGSMIKEWKGEWAVFSPTGALAVEQDDVVRVWDFENNRVNWAFNGRKSAFSAQGDRLALFSREKVEIYSLTDGTLVQTLDGTYDCVGNLHFSPEGDILVGMVTVTQWGYCDYGGDTLALWHISAGAVIKTIPSAGVGPSADPVFLRGGKMLAASTASDLKFLLASDGAVVNSLGGYTHRVAGLAFSPDGQTLAAASGSPLSVQLWRLADTQPLQRLVNEGDINDYDTLDVAFSPDGKTLAARDDFWQLSTGELMTEFIQKMHKLHSFSAESVVFLPDGQNVAVGSF
ncbi:MAG TPA: hypothetical protein VLE49_09880, partial [Anaerolineales bacterium]|nr:hypothetical protein [Anaerolineales bacterium]